MSKPRVILGSDHAGFIFKEKIREWLSRNGYKFDDCGCFSEKPVYYPNFALKVSKVVALNRNTIGILICSTGIGMSIAASKIDRIKAALCTTKFMAKRAREHNNANVLCLGAGVISERLALNLVETFLNTAFSEKEKHVIRNRLIDEKSPKINKEIEAEKRGRSNIPEHVLTGFRK
jgi:ribose 5-phosphate isomerase B